jgi:hypothetical protein
MKRAPFERSRPRTLEGGRRAGAEQQCRASAQFAATTELDACIGRRALRSKVLDGVATRAAPESGATRGDAERMLGRMRSRPNFEGYLRDSMYCAHLSAQLLDGVILSAEELDAAISEELQNLGR